jgi:hypothetical protein
MSEYESASVYGANRYDDLPPRTQEQIDAAYYDWIHSPVGQIIMDDLYNMVCCSYIEDMRGVGQLDLRNYMLARSRAHMDRLRAYERRDDGRP